MQLKLCIYLHIFCFYWQFEFWPRGTDSKRKETLCTHTRFWLIPILCSSPPFSPLLCHVKGVWYYGRIGRKEIYTEGRVAPPSPQAGMQCNGLATLALNAYQKLPITVLFGILFPSKQTILEKSSIPDSLKTSTILEKSSISIRHTEKVQ